MEKVRNHFNPLDRVNTRHKSGFISEEFEAKWSIEVSISFN